MTRPEPPRISSWYRLGGIALALAVVSASILGRNHRNGPTTATIPAYRFDPPEFAFLPGNSVPGLASDPCVLDLNTGEVGRSPLADMQRLDLASLSPYVAGLGRRQIVGRQFVRRDDLMEYALARYELPTSKLLDRTPVKVPPISRPCWDASACDRLFYVGIDGEIYRVDFGAGTGRTSVAKVAWTAGRVGPGSTRSIPTEICWCGGEGAARYLIATMASADESSRAQNRLWWLRLDATGQSIDDAGPLIGPDSGWYRESHPAVSSGPGRSYKLAFLATKNQGDGKGLHTAEIRFDPATGRPGVAPGDLTQVAQDCRACPPLFPPDGRRLFYLPGSAQSMRFAYHELAP